MKKIFTILLLFVMVSGPTACAPSPAPDWQVQSNVGTLDLTGAETAVFLTLPQTLTGITSVLNGDPYTFVRLTSHGNYVLSWPWGSGYAAVEVTNQGYFTKTLAETLRAEKVSPITLTDILRRVGGENITVGLIAKEAMGMLNGFLLWANTAAFDFVPVIIILPATFPGLGETVEG